MSKEDNERFIGHTLLKIHTLKIFVKDKITEIIENGINEDGPDRIKLEKVVIIAISRLQSKSGNLSITFFAIYLFLGPF